MGKATEREFEARFLSVSEFAEQCVEMVQMIADGAGEVVVTQDDLPIARLVSVMGPRGRPAGLMKGRIEIHGDIVGPMRVDWLDVPDETKEAAQ